MTHFAQMLKPEQWEALALSIVLIAITSKFYKHHKLNRQAEISHFTAVAASFCAFASALLSVVLILGGVIIYAFAQVNATVKS